ncbi:MAG: transcription antitermination factor NusB [Syntrophales bacterium]|jgi:N utilization substance protein B|nr:transcription antitermination factor NusB [Syntrophales bacterium]NLN59145.1 transcription antitermination factor NusB [Deltaproteobacteria bacterium]
MSHRRKAREIALKVLYGLDVANRDVETAIDLFWSHFEGPEEAKTFSSFLIGGTWQKRNHLDELISRHSENWSLSRMAKVDRNILRMAVFELLFCDDIPPKVTLNEAIDLGKIYGSENSGSFINGILDALYANLRLADVGEGGLHKLKPESAKNRHT